MKRQQLALERKRDAVEDHFFPAQEQPPIAAIGIREIDPAFLRAIRVLRGVDITGDEQLTAISGEVLFVVIIEKRFRQEMGLTLMLPTVCPSRPIA